MPMTIAEYAADRGYSRQAIYNAIDRNEDLQRETYHGVSNGKSAKFLTDEGVGILDSTLQPSLKSNLTQKKNLELAITTRENQLIQEKADKIEELSNKLTMETERLHREKEEEMTVTRTEMLDRVENVGTDVRAFIAQIRGQYERDLHEAKEKIAKLEQENKDFRDEKVLWNNIDHECQDLRKKNAMLEEQNNKLLNERNTLKSELEWALTHKMQFMAFKRIGEDNQLTR